MKTQTVALTCLEPLKKLLATHFQGRGEDFRDLLASVEGQLPDKLREDLEELAGRADLLSEVSRDSEALLSFVFRCGQLHERLDALRLDRALGRLGFVHADDLPVEHLDKADLDAFARFAAARDRLLKTVADYTLKFLVVSAVLLMVGLSFGLI